MRTLARADTQKSAGQIRYRVRLRDHAIRSIFTTRLYYTLTQIYDNMHECAEMCCCYFPNEVLEFHSIFPGEIILVLSKEILLACQ